MNRLAIGFIAALTVSPLGVSLLHAQANPNPSSTAPRGGPGGTSMISPTPGPATTPALPSASTPDVTLANKDRAKAERAARKAQKKAARAERKAQKKAKKNAPSTQ
jgi:hypothetical protein